MPDDDAIVIRLKLEHFNNGQGRSVPHATQIQFRTKLRFSKPEGRRPRPIPHRATTSVVREPFPQNRWFLLDRLLLHCDSDGIRWDGLPSLRWEAPLAGLVAQLGTSER
jgi:hypothetical protein